MYSHFKMPVAFTTMLFLQMSKADIDRSVCDPPPQGESDFQNFNASGTISIPGFQVNNSYPGSTWNWGRYISEKHANGAESLAQSLGLQTSPLQNLSESNLGYTGCIFIPELDGTPPTTNEDGSCTSSLTTECIQEIKDTLKTISATSGSDLGNTCANAINMAVQKPDSKCYRKWGNSVGQIFPGKSSVNQGNSTAKDKAFPSWSECYNFSDNNYTVYDAAIRRSQPIFLAAWQNDTAKDNEPLGPWFDSRVLCIPTNHTEPGSRTLEDAQKDAAAGASTTTSAASTPTNPGPSVTPTKPSGAAGSMNMSFRALFILIVLVTIIGAH